MNGTPFPRIGLWVRESALYRSIVRHGAADTNRNRSLVIFENLFLHMHPVKVREKTLKFTHTYWLGAVTISAMFVLIATAFFNFFINSFCGNVSYMFI